MARKASLPLRGAYTLLELLIVLALLAALTGLTWPSVRGMLANSRLRAAAKQVRVALVTARGNAIESGEPHRFRYAPGSNWFEIGPLDASAEEDAAFPEQRSRRARRLKTTRDFLPSGVWFADLPSRDLEADRLSPTETRDEDPELRTAIFHPNGRSSQARILLMADNGLVIEVFLRGLTGTAKIGPVEQREAEP